MFDTDYHVHASLIFKGKDLAAYMIDFFLFQPKAGLLNKIYGLSATFKCDQIHNYDLCYELGHT